mmetsp:Transcript_8944/g.16288  ORF Transcript_8944/g.16288 Transcript_8944/m.16288 type:complete len:321 (-) Transcript_8944:219-1181(-)|eukprot:CAMPEP_0198298506 /NCGR_PEP_ID=MMETSP1449-20131203/41043_1 /TAXON_ID=420275 /ORGANISM="Attheya septentrionalis, Strain CCMP2084" /LENGTH=320 /DNA_ID=CAMNT_0043999785 /DNA_START=146 /DNA_END=1108 /DNA_ORIENTATION=-
MSQWRIVRCMTSFLVCMAMIRVGAAEEACSASDETCHDAPTCKEGNFEDKCTGPSNESSMLYRLGGSAQAYKPGAPVKTEVCSPQQTEGQYYKVARWPWSRRSRSYIPKIHVKGRIYSCDSSLNQSASCCCGPVEAENVVIEVWQARPDGTYSSLRPGMEEGVCRATVPLEGSSSFDFMTLAPGSTGALGGLGPNGDFPPYGPPVLHMLVTAPGHSAILTQIGTTTNRPFSDLRPSSLVGGATQKSALPPNVQIESTSLENGDMEIEVNVYIQQSATTDSTPSSHDQIMCSSSLPYVMPGSFFLEPITVCAPSLLSFFPL